MKAKLFNLLLLIAAMVCTSYFSLYGQIYPDHFGTGNDVGISATSSPTQNGDSLETTLNGTGYYTDLASYYRFMAQAGFGATDEDIDSLQQMGIQNWIDWQMTMPYNTYSQVYDTIYNEILLLVDECNPTYEGDNYRISWARKPYYLNMAFWEKAINEKDILRQKAAFSLSQIFVVSPAPGSVLHDAYKGSGYATYYDYLYDGAFGNFRDLLTNVSLSPVMGNYLTYINNKKADTATGTLPDENYAREIMQLFTIGLNELNNNGTPKLDVDGNAIPTYTNQDIKELAKVFTGLYGAALDSVYFESVNATYSFDVRHSGFYDWALPMVMYEPEHDTTEKELPDGSIIPAGQTGMEDINDALDWLFNHPNVGPFIGYRLIQHLVKSNPTPEYVNRVASAFNNNGAGVRGDMGAVFKAILLDPEARDCAWISHPSTGKLLQPMERYLNLMKAFDIDSPSGLLRFIDISLSFGEQRYIHQGFLGAPSVFNFFSPFHTEGAIEEADLVAPEFQILNSVTGIHYLNRMEYAIERMATWGVGAPFRNFTSVDLNGQGFCVTTTIPNEDMPFLDFSDEINVCETGDFAALVDHLNLHLCRGQLNSDVRNNIIQYLEALEAQGKRCSPAYLGQTSIVNDAIFLIISSPSYTILK